MKAARVTLEQWRTLQAVVDCGGYAQAAEYLHRSQSSVSYAVSRLQRQLGVPLLRMQGRKARLTEAGERLLHQSRQLLQDAARLEAHARQLEQGWESELRLAVDAAFPTSVLMAALQAFAGVCPGTRVQLDEVVLSGVDEALRAGTADIAIGGQVPDGFLGDVLLEVVFEAVAHPDHPLHALGRPVGPADLRRGMQVVIRDSGLGRVRDAGWLGAEHRWTVSSIETALTTVSHGLGYAWLPRHRLGQALREGRLAPLPLREGGSYNVPLYLIPGQSEPLGPAACELNACLRRAAQNDER